MVFTGWFDNNWLLHLLLLEQTIRNQLLSNFSNDWVKPQFGFDSMVQWVQLVYSTWVRLVFFFFFSSVVYIFHLLYDWLPPKIFNVSVLFPLLCITLVIRTSCYFFFHLSSQSNILSWMPLILSCLLNRCFYCFFFCCCCWYNVICWEFTLNHSFIYIKHILCDDWADWNLHQFPFGE